MENEIENGNSTNVDNTDLAMLDPDALRKEVERLRGEHAKLSSNNRQLFERAKSAEGFEKNESGEWIKVHKPESKKEKTAKTSGEFDLGEKAYLRSSGINPDEFGFIQKEMEESGIKDIDKLLSSGYFQTKLKETRDVKVVQNATPSGVRSGSDDPKSKADFWIEKGEMPPNTYENRELRESIVNTRLAKEKSASQTP